MTDSWCPSCCLNCLGMQASEDDDHEEQLRKPLMKGSVRSSHGSRQEPAPLVEGQDSDRGEMVLDAEAESTQLESAPLGKRWYHGDITPAQAQTRMRSARVRKDGTYLVYKNRFSPGDYILLVYYSKEYHKLHIRRRSDNRKYVLKDYTYEPVQHDSVKKLVKYHRGLLGKSIQLQQKGSVRLKECVVNPEHEM